MKIAFSYFLCCWVLLFGWGINQSHAQNQREVLEKRRQALQQEIQRISQLQESNTAEKQTVLEKAETLAQKIYATQQLIKTTNQEVNLLSDRIHVNQNKIEEFRKELVELKADYAQMINRSYRSRSRQSRIMFLFSAENFLQAYKRLQYMKQYTNYREQQGEKIKERTLELQHLNNELAGEKRDQEQLIAENRKTQEKLQKDKQTQDRLLAEINKKGSQFKQQIQQRQDEIAKIDAEIQRLIREAIAAENKKTSGTSSASFKLSPEAKALAANFEANKGKLPWPLKSGNITMPFGEYPSPIARNVTVQSNGIRIETGENETVFSVFNGRVLKIQTIKGANKTVLIQHGNYITVYRNLTDLYVKNGDQVTTGQKLGIVGHSRDTDRPTLNFYVFKDTNYLNPSQWILSR